MQKIAVKVLTVLMASFVTVGYAVLPEITKDKDLSLVSYDKNYAGSQASESHIFFSDGTYCYVGGGGGGFIALGGKWQYQTKKYITVQLNPIKQNYFAYWDYDKAGNKQSSVYLTDFVTVDKDKLLLGFGGLTPDNISWYEPNNHDITQLIPPTAEYVFLGNGEKTSKGNYQLMRYSLKSKPFEDDKTFNFYLSKDYNSIDRETMKGFKPSYQLKNKQLIYSNANTLTSLSIDDAVVDKLNLDTEQGLEALKLYDYCHSGKGSLLFYPKYRQAEILQPTVIEWKGTPLNGSWQKVKND